MDQQNQDITALWEKMGSSTGSFFGRVIGYTAQNSLQAYQQMVINPLKQMTHPIENNRSSDEPMSAGSAGSAGSADPAGQTADQPADGAGEACGACGADGAGSAGGVRTKTWQEMGRQFGETVGQSIGMSMDLLIETMEKSASATLPGFPGKEKNDGQLT